MSQQEAKSTVTDPAAKNGTRAAKSHAGGGKLAATSWQEVRLLSLDVRAWRRQALSGARTRSLLAHVGEFLLRQSASSKAAAGRVPATATLSRSERSATAASDDPPGCELVTVEFRECRDASGQVHMCRCELYECAQGSFWQCVIVD